jgi:hypothetical protein
MPSTSLESARAWASFSCGRWTGAAPPPPRHDLPDDATIRRLRFGPFLYYALHLTGDSRSGRFAAEYRHTATANLILLSQAARIRDAMAARGLTPVLLKGGAFLLRYSREHLGLRPMADLDLLVPPAQYAPAAGVLEACGFRLMGGASRASDRASHAESFVSTSAPMPVEIDLHRGLAHWPIATGLTQRILSTTDRVDSWRVPQIADAICLSALHRARHGYSWALVDLFEIKRIVGGLDPAGWRDLLDRASADHLTGAVWASYRQALWWLGADAGDDERLALLAGRLGTTRRRVLDRIAAPERVVVSDSRWTGPLLRNLIVYPLAMTTPARAFAAAAMFLPLRAVEEWTAATRDGLGPAARVRRLWVHAWRGRARRAAP